MTDPMDSVNEKPWWLAPAVKGEGEPLKPCPFCGYPAAWLRSRDESFIRCSDCPVIVRCPSWSGAVHRWNQRTPTQAIEAAPKATPAGMSASLAPEGISYPRLTDEMVEAAARSWFKTGWHPEKCDPGVLAGLLDDVKRMLMAAHMVAPAAGKSVPPPTTSGSPS